MYLFAAFIIALAVTMALIPPLIQCSRIFGLLDRPNERKVHLESIPRVGGISMVVGVLLPIFLWVPLDKDIISLLSGMGILLIFGVLDDRGDLDYRLKFLGQIIAVLIVVIYGDVVIRLIPFHGFDPAPTWFSLPFTVFVLVAVTNAINLADGLDGLAGGIALLSLAGIAFLAYLVDGINVTLVAVSIMGVIIGFLRFNTYPARIFMGDSGSQFLGFTIGVLLVILTQKTSIVINPAIPLFIIGIPLFDTMFVIFKRIYHGYSPFSPDKNHVHHQLLALKFDHYEAVVIIYVVQAIFVVSGMLLRYQSDILVVSLWLLLNMVMAAILVGAGRYRWNIRSPGKESFLFRCANMGISQYTTVFSRRVIWVGLPLLLITGPLIADHVDREMGLASIMLFMLLLFRLAFGFRASFISLRLILYVTAAFVVYLLNDNSLGYWPEAYIEFSYIYYGVIALALVTSAFTSKEEAFQVNPTDYLILLLMIGIAFFPKEQIGNELIAQLIIKLVIMFYAIEFIFRDLKNRWNSITIVSLCSLALIAAKGLVVL